MAYDIWQYINGSQTITFNNGEHIRTAKLADNSILICKNYAAEHLAADNWFIFRSEDTSATEDEYYETFARKGGPRGHVWCPRYMDVGDAFESSSYNIFRWKGNWTSNDGWDQTTNKPAGALSRNDHRTDEDGGYTQPFRITLVAHHDAYQFPNSRVLQDVIHLRCDIPDGSGWRRFEEWLFAKDVGLVAWGEIAQGIYNYYDGLASTRREPYPPVGGWRFDSLVAIEKAYNFPVDQPEKPEPQPEQPFIGMHDAMTIWVAPAALRTQEGYGLTLPELEQIIINAKLSSLMVMDDIVWAEKMRKALNEARGSDDTVVVHRWYNPFNEPSAYIYFDAYIWIDKSPEEIRHFMAQKCAAYPMIYHEVGLNEPHFRFDDPNALAALADWCYRVAKYAVDLGIRIAIGAFAVGKTVQNRFDDLTYTNWHKIWHNLARLAIDHKDKVLITFHEYTCVHMAPAFMHDQRKVLFEFETYADPSQWPDPKNVDPSECYHVGRWNRWLDACQEYEGDTPETGCTEFGLDLNADVLNTKIEEYFTASKYNLAELIPDLYQVCPDPNRREVKHYFENRWGLPEFDKEIRGFLTLFNFFAFQQGVPPEQYTPQQYSKYVYDNWALGSSVYRENVKIIATFAFHAGWYRRDGKGFFLGHPRILPFLDMLKNRSEALDIYPYPSNRAGWEDRSVTVSQGLAFRKEPSIRSALITRFAGTETTLFLNQIAQKDDGTYIWLPVRLNDQFGWAAMKKKDGSGVYITIHPKEEENPVDGIEAIFEIFQMTPEERDRQGSINLTMGLIFKGYDPSVLNSEEFIQIVDQYVIDKEALASDLR